MTVIHKDITLKFPFDCEYTIDGGATWTSLSANTEVLIPENSLDPVTRKVTIRSQSADATTMRRDDLKLMDSRFKEINIRNGKKLTNLSGFLQQCVVDNVYIGYAPELANAYNMMRQGVYDKVNLCELPKLTNASFMFYQSVVHNVGNLDFGRLNSPSYTVFSNIFELSIVDVIGNITCSRAGNIDNMFNNSTINAIGHIDLISPKEFTSDNSSSSIYAYANIDTFPSMSLISKTESPSYGWNPYLFEGMFYHNTFSRTGYLPSISTRRTPTSTSSVAVYGNLFSNANLSTLRFGGLSIFDMGVTAATYAFKQATNSTVGASYDKNKALFSTINLNNQVHVENTSYSNLNSFFTEVNTVRPYYDNPDWFPHVKYLHTKTNTHLVETVGCSSVGMYNRIIKKTVSGISYQSNDRVQPIYECTFGGESFNISNDGATALFAQNGNYAYQVGSDIVIKDSEDVLLSTIVDTTLIAGNFTTDGSKLYLVFGGTIDKAGTENQSVTNTIKIYDTSTGNQVGADITIVNDADEFVAGVYKDKEDYGMKVIKVKYELNADTSLYQWLSSKCDSYFANDDHGDINVTEDIPIDVTYVANHYIESAEFACVNSVTGETARMVGK